MTRTIVISLLTIVLGLYAIGYAQQTYRRGGVRTVSNLQARWHDKDKDPGRFYLYVVIDAVLGVALIAHGLLCFAGIIDYD